MSRTYPILVGLDQNFTIGLAESAVARHRGGDVDGHWADLLEVLHRRVQVDKNITCPKSMFTQDESRLGRGVIARNNRAADEFSGGYRFRFWSVGMRFQLSNRVRAISGRNRPYDRPPVNPRDPYLFVEGGDRTVENGLDNLCFRISWAAERDSSAGPDSQAVTNHLALGRAMDQDSQMIPNDSLPAKVVTDFLQNGMEFGMVYRAWVGDDEEAKRERLVPTYQALFPGVKYSPVPWASDLGSGIELPWEYPNPKYVDNEFIRVVRSDLPALPSPHILGTLLKEMARDRIRNGGAKSGNDVYDLLRAALAVPVVAVYATDGGVKALLDRSGISEAFGVDVFSAKRAELVRLRDHLEMIGTSAPSGAD